MQHNLDKAQNTSPGLDGIYYQMINKIPPQAKEYLLAIFNKYYKQAYFPDHCRTALAISIPKPGKKTHHINKLQVNSANKLICKVFECMINERLLEYLEMRNVFTGIQFGCRKNENTMDDLVRLKSEVR